MEESDFINKLEMLNIGKILKHDFFIPSYQRGYRWTDKQIKALLEDIWDFKLENHGSEEFYCLQPIVVKEVIHNEKSYWEIIDGQQRLTTILIILFYFNELQFKKPKQIFSIKFATRDDSSMFLKNIEKKELAESNVDYYHIHEAYKEVVKWFNDKDLENPTFPGAFYDTLINSVNIIWYEIVESENLEHTVNAIDVFTRINMGKISLTNAELIKALFLQKKNFEDNQIYKQLKIAKEWDEIEKKLQDDSFWYFIYSKKNGIFYENRIEYIFDLLKGRTKEHEEFFTFNAFSNSLKDNLAHDSIENIVESNWLNIKNYFQRFEEWFLNPQLYHLVGYLIQYEYDIDSLHTASTNKTKSDFIVHVDDIVKKWFKGIIIEELDYKIDRDKIRRILLFFNIKTIISSQDAEVRFPFDKYKKDSWDIEHVCSQTEIVIKKEKRKDWALDILEYFTGEKGFSDEIHVILKISEKENQKNRVQKLTDIADKNYCLDLISLLESDKSNDNEFNALYDSLRSRFKENELTENDSIANLALLDSNTNRSYKNAMFPIKRKQIIENDANGKFVPICTKNLFLKYYSRQMSDVMYWNMTDANDYLTAIKKTLKQYLN
jgi:uncharacterized protein with ParB-like and HNH nuclease domain